MPKRVDYISYETAICQLNRAADRSSYILSHQTVSNIYYYYYELLFALFFIIKGYFLNHLYHCIL